MSNHNAEQWDQERFKVSFSGTTFTKKNHSYSTDWAVFLFDIDIGNATLDPSIETNRLYVINKTTNTFQLSTKPNGSEPPINMQSSGTAFLLYATVISFPSTDNARQNKITNLKPNNKSNTATLPKKAKQATATIQSKPKGRKSLSEQIREKNLRCIIQNPGQCCQRYVDKCGARRECIQEGEWVQSCCDYQESLRSPKQQKAWALARSINEQLKSGVKPNDVKVDRNAMAEVAFLGSMPGLDYVRNWDKKCTNNQNGIITRARDEFGILGTAAKYKKPNRPNDSSRKNKFPPEWRGPRIIFLV